MGADTAEKWNVWSIGQGGNRLVVDSGTEQECADAATARNAALGCDSAYVALPDGDVPEGTIARDAGVPLDWALQEALGGMDLLASSWRQQARQCGETDPVRARTLRECARNLAHMAAQMR